MKKITLSIAIITLFFSNAAFSKNKSSSYDFCYTLAEPENSNALWATGGIPINSCDPQTIQNMIVQEYATIGIQTFDNNHERSYYFINSKNLESSGTPSHRNVYEYKRKGKNIDTYHNGCLTKEEIIKETSSYIILLEKGEYDIQNCNPAILKAGDISKGKTTKYIKIKK